MRPARWFALTSPAMLGAGLLSSIALAPAQGLPVQAAASIGRAPTIRDAIAQVRVQWSSSIDGQLGAFSRDGRFFAYVTWYGDLERNTNVYDLVVADFGLRGKPPKSWTVLTRSFPGDSADQTASPIEQIRFLDDNRTIAFLDRPAAGKRTVTVVDIFSKQAHPLLRDAPLIRDFVANAGGLRAWSRAIDPPGRSARELRAEGDGLFLWDQSQFVTGDASASGVVLNPNQRLRREFIVEGDASPKVVYSPRPAQGGLSWRSGEETDRALIVDPSEDWSLNNWGYFKGDPLGRKALIFPYVPLLNAKQIAAYPWFKDLKVWKAKLASPVGLMDLGTGTVEALLDAPNPMPSSSSIGGPPKWSPDGQKVVLYSLLPKDNPANAAAPPRWVEVEVETRAYRSLPISDEWRVIGWSPDGNTLVVAGIDRYATLSRKSDGSWAAPARPRILANANWRWTPATNGRTVVGLVENFTTPPELVALDLATGRQTRLTDLNPKLRTLRYSPVEPIAWSNSGSKNSTGFLIKPAGYIAGRRYPLVILLDDGDARDMKRPYLLDGVRQLNGHAIQMAAAAGLMVLYALEPRGIAADFANECDKMVAHIDGAIDTLDAKGLIDMDRVGLSGWSRAAYQTNCYIIHGHREIAAATQMDGGGWEYFPTMRPFRDEELVRITTPLLIETHGLRTMMSQSSFADRMNELGRPVEILYFPSAPHSTVRPQHRLRSLQTHIDWWRFWLMDEEDASPSKAEQYIHWRKLRDVQNRAMQ